MKKVFLAGIALLMMGFSVNSMAGWIDGKITEIRQYPSELRIIVKRASDSADISLKVDPSSTIIKEILAIALTAKTSNSDVTAYATDNKWTSIILK